MYWSKTKQQKNKKTRGEKIGSFYYKLVPVQNTLQNNLRKLTRTTSSNNKKTLRTKKDHKKTNMEVDRRWILRKNYWTQ